MFLGLSSLVPLVVHLTSLCIPSQTLHNRCSVNASQMNTCVQMYKADMASLSEFIKWIIKIITGDLSLLPITCISCSLSFFLLQLSNISLFSAILPSFPPFFFLSFLFCFFHFLLHVFFQVLLFLCLLFTYWSPELQWTSCCATGNPRG